MGKNPCKFEGFFEHDALNGFAKMEVYKEFYDEQVYCHFKNSVIDGPYIKQSSLGGQEI